ncbi:MAG: HAD-IC family P-type ATPase [Candidatus Kapabacteria bacterium]|nr:HAD-IC family P-type ATPase [Candidatus Kapabacteria bacterium]
MSLTATIWHARSRAEIEEELETSTTLGLALEEVRIRLLRDGANELPVAPQEHPILRFLRQLRAPLIYILIVSGIITAYLGGIADASVIIGVVVLNAVIGFFQEGKAIASLQSLSKSVRGNASVIRGGEQLRVPMHDLAAGDLVVLESGDRVPADMRLTWVKDFAVAEASLTGESVPVDKGIDSIIESTSLADRVNMAYASTVVTRGSARGLVVATGARTELGNISALLRDTPSLSTPLTHQIEKFSNVLLWAILALACATFVVGVARGESMVEMLLASVALSVGAIPEGLPAAVTIILAIGVGKMTRRVRLRKIK